MGRKFVVGGNWKMNGDKNQINEIINNLKKGPLDPNVEVMYFFVFVFCFLYYPHCSMVRVTN